jgi:hypothetical protein
MMRFAGVCSASLIALSPALVYPELHMSEAGAAVGVLCAAAVFVPSLGLAVFGSIVALLVFTVAVQLASAAYTVFAALLLGLGLLILLDTTQFEQRFARAEGKTSIVNAHLSYFGLAALLSALAALVIVLVAATVSQDLGASTRTIIALLGCSLSIAAMMWKALR